MHKRATARWEHGIATPPRLHFKDHGGILGPPPYIVLTSPVLVKPVGKKTVALSPVIVQTYREETTTGKMTIKALPARGPANLGSVVYR